MTKAMVLESKYGKVQVSYVRRKDGQFSYYQAEMLDGLYKGLAAGDERFQVAIDKLNGLCDQLAEMTAKREAREKQEQEKETAQRIEKSQRMKKLNRKAWEIKKRTGFSWKECFQLAVGNLKRMETAAEKAINEVSVIVKIALESIAENGMYAIMTISSSFEEVKNALVSIGCWEDRVMTDSKRVFWMA